MISFYPARCLIHLLSLPEHIQAAADIVDYPHVDNGPDYHQGGTALRGNPPVIEPSGTVARGPEKRVNPALVYFTAIRGGSPPTHMPLWFAGVGSSFRDAKHSDASPGASL